MKRVLVVVAAMVLLFVISIHLPAFCGTVKYYPDMPGGKMSADGRCIVFQSDADNLVANDTNNATDVFVRDLTTGPTTRVSISSILSAYGHRILSATMQSPVQRLLSVFLQ